MWSLAVASTSQCCERICPGPASAQPIAICSLSLFSFSAPLSLSPPPSFLPSFLPAFVFSSIALKSCCAVCKPLWCPVRQAQRMRAWRMHACAPYCATVPKQDKTKKKGGGANPNSNNKTGKRNKEERDQLCRRQLLIFSSRHSANCTAHVPLSFHHNAAAAAVVVVVVRLVVACVVVVVVAAAVVDVVVVVVRLWIDATSRVRTREQTTMRLWSRPLTSHSVGCCRVQSRGVSGGESDGALETAAPTQWQRENNARESDAVCACVCVCVRARVPVCVCLSCRHLLPIETHTHTNALTPQFKRTYASWCSGKVWFRRVLGRHICRAIPTSNGRVFRGQVS